MLHCTIAGVQRFRYAVMHSSAAHGENATGRYMPGMIRPVPSRWQGAILVCGKCTRRVDGGFGKKGRRSLAQLLRKAGLGGRGRKADRGIVETGCLKLCPKRAVVAIDSRRPDRWLVVPAGTPRDDVLRRFDEPGVADAPPSQSAGMPAAPSEILHEP